MKYGLKEERGIVLISTIFMLAVIVTMIAAFYRVSKVEISSTFYNKQSTNGFYAAEGALNIRASEIKATFDGYNLPTGTSPTSSAPCTAGDNGSGDFACKRYNINKQTVTTYMVENSGNPINITIPPGELYENLNATEYGYSVHAVAQDKSGHTTSKLELGFKSRLVPLFQFLFFYDKDLEIFSAPELVLEGPIHTNGDLYFRSNYGGIFVNSNITASEDLYIGLKARPNSCGSSLAFIHFADQTIPNPVVPGDYLEYDNCHLVGGLQPERPQSDFDPYNGMVKLHVPEVTVPPVDSFDPTPGKVFWDRADLRLVLNLNSSNLPDISVSPTGIEVRTAGNTVDVAKTNLLNSCTGSISGTAVWNSDANADDFFDMRESPTGTRRSELLEVDMEALLDCLDSTNFLGSGKSLDDTSDGGLVFYMTVQGPNSSDLLSHYGIRIQNADELQSGQSGAATVKGLSIVSNHAVYTKGNYNSVNKIPSAIMADMYVILSNAWEDKDSNKYLEHRIAEDTTVNTALIYGSPTTCKRLHSWPEGQPCYPNVSNSTDSSGGIMNHIRHLEAWSSSGNKHFGPDPRPSSFLYSLAYRGSAVSLGNSRHNNGQWMWGRIRKDEYTEVPDPYKGNYLPPERNFSYEQDFNNLDNLPPLTPRFVYLKQELFIKDFGQ